MAWNRTVPPWIDIMDLTPRVNSVQSRVTTANTKINNDLIPKMDGITELDDINRESTILGSGTSTISGTVGSVADIEIEGRTLISLGNSNLEAGKQYVVADKKTKVTTDTVTYTGVSKFTKGTTTVSTANFVSKVYQSTVANPHKVRYAASTTMLAPNNGTDLEQAGYDRINSLNTVVQSIAYNGGGTPVTAQIVFSFDIIQEIERKLGIIPKTALADKVQWVKDNVENFTAKWYGFGSSVGGNKASLAYYTTSWVTGSASHTSATVAILTRSLSVQADLNGLVQSDGFIHYLAYADTSDGTIVSSISTDYIDLVITLKATAQLNTRPTIVRVENYEGKILGSAVENPHDLKYKSDPVILESPSNILTTPAQSIFTNVGKLDGAIWGRITSAVGGIALSLFSFNLIEAVERNVGRIPRSTVADKVQWLKDNISKLTGNWHGFGSSVGGNKASFTTWSTTGVWVTASSHTLGTVSPLIRVDTTNVISRIDTNGFVHFLAYAEPSDGVTPSIINTDYVDLEIQLSPTADFTRPKVVLYEVPSTEYAKILVDWNADEVVNRYPIVEGVQHLQGVGVVSEGENLLPVGEHKGTFDITKPSANSQLLSVISKNVKLAPNTQYTISFDNVGDYNRFTYFLTALEVPSNVPDHNGIYTLHQSDPNKGGSGSISSLPKGKYSTTFTTTSKAIYFHFTTSSANPAEFVPMPFVHFKDIMLNIGTVVKPYAPYNPSYLYADVKLGAVGTSKDVLYEQDGAKFVRKAIEKDVLLGGDLSWTLSDDQVGFKRFITPMTGIAVLANNLFTKYDGKPLRYFSSISLVTQADYSYANTANIIVSASDTDTGFGETFVPSTAEIKAYFYGWKMNNGTFGTNYDGTGTKTWVPIGDANNARAVTVLPTSPSPTQLDGTIQPYKVSYAVLTPQTINVTDRVEGSLKVNGLTQVSVESGIVVREKVTPKVNSGTLQTVINDNGVNYETTRFKNKALKILGVYKNGQLEKQWIPTKDVSAYGVERAVLSSADKALYDPTAEYAVTYVALDKHLLTSGYTNLKLTYSKNISTSVQDLVGKSEDNSVSTSVQSKLLVDILARLKAGGI